MSEVIVIHQEKVESARQRQQLILESDWQNWERRCL